MNDNNSNLLAMEAFFNELSVEEQLKFGFNIEFSKRLISRRKELGWTQEVLAQKSGVNRVTIAKLEKFQRTASVEVILKLLNALGLKIQFVEQTEKQ